jgi:hypothetical protein
MGETLYENQGLLESRMQGSRLRSSISLLRSSTRAYNNYRDPPKGTQKPENRNYPQTPEKVISLATSRSHKKILRSLETHEMGKEKRRLTTPSTTTTATNSNKL